MRTAAKYLWPTLIYHWGKAVIKPIVHLKHQSSGLRRDINEGKNKAKSRCGPDRTSRFNIKDRSEGKINYFSVAGNLIQK